MKYRNQYLLMRHGHSLANQEGIIASDPRSALTAFGLSSLGKEQISDQLDGWSWPTPTQIYHSDFLRTAETAERVGAHFALAPVIDPQLRERYFGEFDGLPDALYHDVWRLDAQDPSHQRFEVESVRSVSQRMHQALYRLDQCHAGETILLVSHGDPLQILLTTLEGKALSAHRERPSLAPASITALGLSDNR
ncbi:histidine phosphatase family protein [Litchfieldella xinjiangensis]|uniref:histidine phosphatase family protein n=1 Tax=Litchfieldella xinjiangensis TaxID=1166948 RepID=UPI0005B9A065|nr:histidine phosphatase family protein [Halomonas xinjiangensis]